MASERPASLAVPEVDVLKERTDMVSKFLLGDVGLSPEEPRWCPDVRVEMTLAAAPETEPKYGLEEVE